MIEKQKKNLIILSFIAIFIVCFFVFKEGKASINNQINYQGKLADSSGNPISSNLNFTFRIYDDSSNCNTGNTPEWTETKSITPTSKGLFSTMLGSSTPITLDFDESTTTDGYWLEVQIGTERLTPCKRLGAVPQAFNSNNLKGTGLIDITNGGTESVATIENTGTGNSLVINDQAGDTTSFIIDNSGNVGIGVGSVDSNIKTEIMSTGEQLRLAYDSSNYSSFTVDSSGNLNINPTGYLTLSNIQENSISTNAINWSVGKQVLHAEYPGASLSADESNNTGSMTSDSVSVDGMNYYEWISTESDVLNDYDVRLSFTLPNEFSSWTSSSIVIDFVTKTTLATDNKLDLLLYENGNASSVATLSDQVSGTGETWQTATLNGTSWSNCNSAGDSCNLILKMSSMNSNYVRIGDITLNYNR